MASVEHTDPTRCVVFVADDDPVIRHLIEYVLRRDGREVHSFADGGSALRAIEECDRPPRLLITDYMMPEMNGLELVAHSRARIPGLKTLSISGTKELPELAMPDHRPDRFLPKPFTVAAFLGAIHELIGEA